MLPEYVMGLFMSPFVMVAVIALYVYGQVRAALLWQGSWRGLALFLLVGQLYWQGVMIWRQGEISPPTLFLGSIVGGGMLLSLFVSQILLSRIR